MMSPAFPSASTSSRRMTFIGLPLPHLRGGERNQRHDAGLLDLDRQLPLVGRAGPRDPPGDDFAAFGNEVLEHVDVLVVDLQLLLGAETAELLPGVAPLRASRGGPGGFARRGAGFFPWGCSSVLSSWTGSFCIVTPLKRDILVLLFRG